MKNYTILNPDVIEANMMNNRDMIRQFISLYLTQTPLDFEALKIAVANSDHAEIANKAHHIKPTMEYVGASDLRKKFQELENYGKTKEDMEIIVHFFTKTEAFIQIFMQELKSYYDGISMGLLDENE